MLLGTLHNVAPRDGGVDIWVNIEWGSGAIALDEKYVVSPELRGWRSDHRQVMLRNVGEQLKGGEGGGLSMAWGEDTRTAQVARDSESCFCDRSSSFQGRWQKHHARYELNM